MSKILYIAGYGRSGSTLLSILLDNLSGVTALGGVAGLPSYLGVRGRECTCNRSYIECPLWSKVIKNLPGNVGFIKRLGKIQKRIEPWYKGIRSLVKHRIRKEYSRRMTDFLRSVQKETQSQVFVDSSKSAYPYMWRPLSLSEIEGVEVFVIHLVREATDVVSSRKEGRNIDIERGDHTPLGLWASFVGLGGWLAANIAALRIRRDLKSTQSMVVRYSDLVHSPQKELERIVGRVDLPGISADTAFQEDGSLGVGHLVGSNRMARRNQKIKIHPSKSSSSNLSHFEKVVVDKVTNPIKKIILN